jgi:hypothetical protein
VGFLGPCEQSARVEQSYQKIAHRVRIAGRNDPKANIFQLVHNWLCDEKNAKWHLILDNVDDARLLYEALPSSQDKPRTSFTGMSNQPLLAYLPASQNGSILITTRSREVALKLVEQSDLIAVEPMDEAHALKLFEKKLGNDESMVIAELAAALEFMPLAIVQAAAYISQTRYSVQQYLEEFRRSDRKKTSLLNHAGGQLRRDWEAKNSIITTWEISFDHIRQARLSAANLLSLMSFFDRQGIPEALVRRIETGQSREDLGGADADTEEDSDEDSESTGDDGFEDDILTLRNYSFISVNADKTTFEMHRLVQIAMREWLSAHGELERWKQQFIENLSIEFPTGEYENWEKCQSLFPHARSAVEQRPDKKDSLKEWASLLYNAAWYAWRRGNVSDAEKMSVRVVKTRKKLFGQENEGTLNAMRMAGLVYNLGGRWTEAEELLVQVTETKKRVLGEDHLDTLISMGNLASTYRHQGKWQEAEDLEVQVMETRNRVLGAEHPDTLTSITNLALTYQYQGRWQEAEVLQVQVIETKKRVLGAEHLDTLISIGNLASTFWNQGQLKEAENLNVQVLETSKRVLGIEHPYTLTSMSNLASTYSNQGRWKEAEELGVQVIETRKRVLGAEHPDTLTSMGNLAFNWKGQGQDIEALKLMEECLQLRTRILGIDHPDTITFSIALTRWQTEELDISAAGVGKEE